MQSLRRLKTEVYELSGRIKQESKNMPKIAAKESQNLLMSLMKAEAGASAEAKKAEKDMSEESKTVSILEKSRLVAIREHRDELMLKVEKKAGLVESLSQAASSSSRLVPLILILILILVESLSQEFRNLNHIGERNFLHSELKAKKAMGAPGVVKESSGKRLREAKKKGMKDDEYGNYEKMEKISVHAAVKEAHEEAAGHGERLKKEAESDVLSRWCFMHYCIDQ